MQSQQLDQQQTKHQSSSVDAIEVPVELLAEPEAVSGIAGGIGDYVIQGGELLFDGVSLVFELAGELLSGLGS